MKKLYRRFKPMFGSFVEIQLFENDQENFDKTFEVMKQAEELLSAHSENSELTKLNRSVNKKILLDPITLDILRKSIQMMKETDSLFDITLGGIQQRENLLPTYDGQSDNIPLGHYEDILIEDSTCFLKKPLTLTLDGVAKGYAVDLAYKKLISLGISSGYINAGGDLRIFGEIELPLYQRGAYGKNKYLGNFKNISLATSRVSSSPTEDFTSQIYSRKQRFKGRTKICTIAAPETWIADALTKATAICDDMSQRALLLKKFNAQFLS